jgi:hypothetical protein
VPSDHDLLFGKLAVKKGHCTQERLDRCLAIQAALTLRIPLGRILVQEGFLTEEQHSLILDLQRANMSAIDPLLRKQRESILFGKLAVRVGLLTPVEANECLARQAAEGEKRSLGEIMISSGFMTARQVKDLLARQQKKIMSCPTCVLSFTVLSISHGKKTIACPRCKGPLVDGKPSDSMRTDAEFATQVLRITKREAAPGIQADSRIIPPGAAKIKTRCVICEKLLEGTLDSTGRLRCPICNTTFVPK